MGYNSSGKKPIEFAGKTGHSEFIDEESKKFLSHCYIPQQKFDLNNFSNLFNALDEKDSNIKYVIAIDGGLSSITAKKFPSSKLVAIKIGALFLDLKKIENLKDKEFISPKEINTIKDAAKSKFILPVKNIMNDNYESFTHFVRSTIFNFFSKENFNLASALKWLIFREFRDIPENEWNLATHPINPNIKNIKLKRSEFVNFVTNNNGEIYITDILRLHELIDEDTGAEGIVNYLLSAIEQLLMIFIIKEIYTRNPSKLSEFLFILDRPLAFFGQTANLHKPMREMIVYFLLKGIELNIIGIEKSGAFVEHAKILSEENVLKKGEYILLSNDYIYKNILPRLYNDENLYGRTTYYGGKVIFNSKYENINVCTIPIKNYDKIKNPNVEDFVNLNEILNIIQTLKCNMYENSILPIALINNAVSISKYPGEISLKRFFKSILN